MSYELGMWFRLMRQSLPTMLPGGLRPPSVRAQARRDRVWQVTPRYGGVTDAYERRVEKDTASLLCLPRQKAGRDPLCSEECI
jgi:hypothetical protein